MLLKGLKKLLIIIQNDRLLAYWQLVNWLCVAANGSQQANKQIANCSK